MNSVQIVVTNDLHQECGENKAVSRLWRKLSNNQKLLEIEQKAVWWKLSSVQKVVKIVNSLQYVWRKKLGMNIIVHNLAVSTVQ